MTERPPPSSPTPAMADTTATSEPLSREVIWQRIRATSKDQVILDEMVRLGFWPAGDGLPTDPAAEIAEETALRAELAALQTERGRINDEDRLRRQIRLERFAQARKKRKETLARREAERAQRAQERAERKRNGVTYLGEGVSGGLNHQRGDRDRLKRYDLPALNDAMEVAAFLGVSVGELRFLTFHRAVSTVSHYKRFSVPKKSGGERVISAPMPRLKELQRRLLDDVLAKVPCHDAAHGFVKGRDIVSGARPHLQASVLINLDLKDFFPSVSYRRVKGLFVALGYSEQVATLFALLCTEAETQEFDLDGTRYFVQQSERHLPQGSPASPQITNLICRRLDDQLTRQSAALGWTYTRYADDLSFSRRDDDVSGEEVRRLLGRVRFLVERAGFSVHPEKTRVMRKGRRQEVTGIGVNDTAPRVERRKLRQFRAALHHLRKSGLRGVHFSGASHAAGDDVIAALEGYAAFVLHVDPARGAQLREELAAVCAAQSLRRRATPRPQASSPRWRRYEDPPDAADADPPTEAQPAEAAPTQRPEEPRSPETAAPQKPWWKFW